MEENMKEHRDANNRLIIDFYNIEASKYENITKRIVQEFDLKSLSSKVTGFDEIFQDFILNDKKLGLNGIFGLKIKMLRL